MTKYTIDGVTYDTASPEFIQAITLRDKRIDGEIATLTSERDKLTAERDAEKARADAAEKARADAEDPERLDSLVAARVALVSNARRVLGADATLDGKSDRDIMIATIRHDDDSFEADGKSDDYVRAYFEASTKNARRHDEGGKGIAAVRSAAVDSTKRRNDNSDDGTVDRYDADAARRRMMENNRTAAEQPLRFSKSS